jgi:hypothetical protein
MLDLPPTQILTRTSTFDYLLPPPSCHNIPYTNPLFYTIQKTQKKRKKEIEVACSLPPSPASEKLHQHKIDASTHPPNSYSILPILHPTHTAIKKETRYMSEKGKKSSTPKRFELLLPKEMP